MATILDMLRLANSNLQSLPQPQGFGSKTCFALATLRLRNAICLLEKGYPIGANADTLLNLTPVEEVPNYQPPASTETPSGLADLEARVRCLESWTPSIQHRLNTLEAMRKDDVMDKPVGCLQLSTRVRNAVLLAGAKTVGDLVEMHRNNSLRCLRNFGDKCRTEVERVLRDVTLDLLRNAPPATDTTSPTAATPAHDPSPAAAAPA